MICYKAFRHDYQGLTSVCRGDGFDVFKYKVTYSPYTINYPRVLHTRLFAYTNLQDAKDFLKQEFWNDRMEIWKCDGTDHKECLAISRPENLEAYWTLINSGKFAVSVEGYNWGQTLIFNDGSRVDCIRYKHPGAITISSVKLLEKVYSE